jgi:hypothetical protein
MKSKSIAIFGLLAISLIFALEVGAKDISKGVLSEMTTTRISNQRERISIPSREMTPADNPFKGLSNKETISLNILYCHSALGQDANGMLFRGYAARDMNISNWVIWWNVSYDTGKTWNGCCAWDIYRATYPSLDFWGNTSRFFATFVTPSAYSNGGAIFLLEFGDPADIETWSGRWADFLDQGWYGMVMSDIACDNGRESWNWGVQSLVISRTYTGSNLNNAPALFYQINSSGYTTVDWFAGFDGCRTTAVDIDNATGKTYAVYDHLDTARQQWQLFIWQEIFGIWDSGGCAMSKEYVDSTINIGYPAVAADNGNLVIVAAVHDDDTPDDTDIVCWHTSDGIVTNLSAPVIIAGSSGSENFPRISHIEERKFAVTFSRNDTLFASYTCDGGANWSIPEPVSSNDTLITEYRNSDISNGGKVAGWEYRYGIDAGLHYASLAPGDSDGDGIVNYCDNCPAQSNPAQEDEDGDGIGDLCDNCPSTANNNQLDSDMDGEGDLCDICPHDGDNDIDADGICGDVDNCPLIANSLQEDTDTDGIGNLCDNCVDVANPNQSDNDTDGLGDACDPDDDNDGIDDIADNCPMVYNPDQTDENTNGIGDACEYLCGDANGDGKRNLLDVSYIINFLYRAGPSPIPIWKAADADNNGKINLLDVSYLINFLYRSGPTPICP